MPLTIQSHDFTIRLEPMFVMYGSPMRISMHGEMMTVMLDTVVNNFDLFASQAQSFTDTSHHPGFLKRGTRTI